MDLKRETIKKVKVGMGMRGLRMEPEDAEVVSQRMVKGMGEGDRHV